jgi:hypothetical protein
MTFEKKLRAVVKQTRSDKRAGIKPDKLLKNLNRGVRAAVKQKFIHKRATARR